MVLAGLGVWISARSQENPTRSAASANTNDVSTSLPPRCRTDQLTWQVAQRNGIAGGSIVLKRLHNISHQGCSLQGSPHVHTFVTAQPSAALPFRQETIYAPHPSGSVVIAPGGWASFYEIIHADNYDPTLTLPPMTSRWRLPGATQPIATAISPSHTITGGYRIITVFVSNIYSGKFPSHTPGIQWSNNSGHPPLPARQKKDRE